MKRLFWLIGVLAVLVGAVAIAAPRLVSPDAVKTRVAEQMSAWTGRAVSMRGDPVVSLFPRPSVRLNDVRVAGPDPMIDADVVRMEALEGTIRILPLLVGDVAVESFVMVRPRVRLVRDEAGRRNWLFDSGAAALQLAFAGDVSLGEFVLQDGEIIYEDRESGRVERLHGVELALNWLSVRRPLSLKGTAVWRGENIALQLAARDPFSFLRGRDTPLEARLDAPPLRASLEGRAADFKRARFDGTLTVDTPSLRRLLNWLGNDLPPGSTLGQTRLAGPATLDQQALSVSRASFSLDGNEATGALQVVFGDRPEVSGTLAFPRLDLGPYFAGLRSEIATHGEEWRHVQLDTGWFHRLDSDVRLSAERVTIGSLAFGDAAVSLLLKNGRAEIGLADASFYGGRVSGNLAVEDAGDAGAVMETHLRAKSFDLSEVRTALGINADLSGLSTVALDLNTAGASLGHLMTGLDGNIALGAARGTLPLGLEAMALALRSGDLERTFAAGSATVFETFDAAVGFADQAAVLQRAALDASSYAAELSGHIGLHTGRVALNGALSLAGSDGPAAPFAIYGTLRQPTVSLLPFGDN